MLSGGIFRQEIYFNFIDSEKLPFLLSSNAMENNTCDRGCTCKHEKMSFDFGWINILGHQKSDETEGCRGLMKHNCEKNYKLERRVF